MEMNWLRTFVAAAEAGSFAAAGRRVGVTRDQASKAVARLEAHLGMRLFARTTRFLRLTEAGSAYYERVGPALAAIAEAERAVQVHDAAPAGRLRVNAPAMFGAMTLAPLIPGYLASCPGIRLELMLDDRVLDPVPNDFDVTLRIAVAGVGTRLGAVTRRLFAAPTYLARAGALDDPDDLRLHACLLYSHLATGVLWVLRRGADERAVEINSYLTSNSGSVLLQTTLAGLGVAMMPDFLAASYLRTGELRTVLPDWRPAELGVHAIVPPAMMASRRVGSFVSFLQDALRETKVAGDRR